MICKWERNPLFNKANKIPKWRYNLHHVFKHIHFSRMVMANSNPCHLPSWRHHRDEAERLVLYRTQTLRALQWPWTLHPERMISWTWQGEAHRHRRPFPEAWVTALIFLPPDCVWVRIQASARRKDSDRKISKRVADSSAVPHHHILDRASFTRKATRIIHSQRYINRPVWLQQTQTSFQFMICRITLSF